jgi:ubiquinone/menaquinone biosynthesis C-methylase UbiE
VPRAAQAISHDPGSVTFRPSDGTRLPFNDVELDAIYCISVLEHVERPENTVREIARVLKPEGRLILTIDLDLNGKHEIGQEGYRCGVLCAYSLFKKGGSVPCFVREWC